MSVAPHAGVVDFGTFTPPTVSQNGIQGEVPQPLIGQENYVLTGNGWSSLGDLGSLTYQGTWDASTNTPTLVSSVGTQGYYYVVSVAGNTDLNGITTWTVGDWAIFSGSVWQKIEGGSTVDITGGQINGTTIGNINPASGAFTTLSASSTVSGTGFQNYLASPPPIGSVSPNTGKFTSVTTPSVTATTTDLTLSAISTGAIKFNTLNGEQLRVIDNGSTASRYLVASGSSSSSNPNLGSSAGPLVLYGGANQGILFFSNAYAQQQFAITHTASAVNYLQVTGAATTGFPTISAQGSDTNIGITYTAKGSSRHVFTTGNGTQFRINDATSSVNTLETTGAATGFATRLYSQGSDTNISMAFLSKGTGAIDLAAGSSGINISNGGTVTAATLTNAGTGYTSFPTTTVSAPTTTGGVQAVLSFTRMYPSGGSITSGGTGYTVGDVLTLVGGTFVTSAATLTVSTVSSGVITGYTISAANSYTVLPSSPTSVTGGTGTGATFTLTYSLGALAVISNAGSGYIEQPTVSFSGGGGSGATAYAVVGTTTVTRSLGTLMDFYTPAGLSFEVTDSSATPTAYLQAVSGGTGQNGGYIRSNGSATNPNIYFQTKGTGSIGFYSNYQVSTAQQFNITHTASAVNYVQVTGSVTSAAASALGGLLFTGSDTSPNFAITTKGAGYIAFCGNASTNNQSFRISNAYVANTGNLLQVQAVGAGLAPSISPISGPSGTDANISMVLQPKGTGAIDLAAGSSGINISNGGTVTALTRTASGSGYTSIPSVVITAPTTAGGVQATATVTAVPFGTSPTITSGGTGYTVGDLLTFVGGTFTGLSNATVTSVSAGVITGINYTNYAQYTVLPTNPISVTGGTGTGATFTINNYGIGTIFTITAAGSGYIEQPTVSFSGGGGSSAAAYATVGSGTIVKSIGSTMSFYSPSGEIVRMADVGANAVNFVLMSGSATNGTPYTRSAGSDTNIPFFIGSKGTGAVSVFTNAGAQEQMRVAHTASAVNYVQVTGNVTTGRPTISAQGSDVNISLGYDAKGTGGHTFRAGGNTQVLINNTSTAVNALNLTGSVTGTAVPISVTGTDTNIDLALTPKGTGRVKFGTLTATADAPITGYIEILDSSGTLRKLAVIA